ncbi:hypothetical protein MXB_2662 [Myxobolus squamalis]|nr:hypothetical protein MXB_2662 [Myxobolus squamalis]
MGGKLSEGIDFCDNLCRCIIRCIIIMGMPYGNINNFEFKCKLDHIKRQFGEVTAHDYYHNLCMRTVNQSIGRAIRHSSDYAAIILLDSRYVDWSCNSAQL